ncbi:MAG TPA: biotin/lipoyl-containing protein, partial [Alphaproteobacteria bacterium]|nr:biotin/lipoyl-containing protein [Alphaproteobacteria bacterium]
QKVIEEAPSPFVDAGMRRAMGEQAVALAKAVGYRSAGTVEFVTGADKNFYFLEMNTRLQVEHPVTEMITGLDLVEMMIRVAAGEPLGITQDDVALDGWAVESRIYAEDPARGFLPSIGRLVRFFTPEETNSVRIDTGVGEGDEISMHYDPMIAKLITHGPDRAAAIARMGEALDGFLVGGINTNVPFLASVCRNACFGKGMLTTNFIAEEYGDAYAADTPDDTVAEVLAGVAALIEGRVAARAAALGSQPDGKRQDLTISIGESEWQVGVTLVESGCDLKIGSKTLAVRDDGWCPGDSIFRGRIGERDVVVQVARGAREAWRLVHGGAAVDVLVRSARAAAVAARMPKKEPPDLSKFLLSPMPGLVVSVAVTAGDMVKAGEPLCVVDAMKMENVLRAEREVTVADVKASTGDSLEADQVIMIFE